MNFHELCEVLPDLHRNNEGEPTSWYVNEALGNYLYKNIKSGMRTMETGAGLSTVLFAQAGAHHYCFVHCKDEVKRIKKFCRKHGISTRRVKFYVGGSELTLPKHCPKNLDFVLIDGGHGFPTPFIDWYYSQRNLNVGGTVVVDDTQIWTGDTLSHFLDQEPKWQRLDDWPYRTAIFKKTAEGEEYLDWFYQPYVHERSNTDSLLTTELSDWKDKGDDSSMTT